MARSRIRRDDDDAGGLDSLLDTMTNVVGILVLVLIATQLGVQQAVTRAVDVDKLVSPEDLEAKRKELALSQEQRELILAQLENKDEDNTKAIEIKVADLRRKAEEKRRNLEQEQQAANTYAMKIEADRKQADEARKKIKELEDNLNNRQQMQADITSSLEQEARLKSLLDDTPVPQALPAKIVTLPDPQPAPEGAQRLTFICVYNKIYPIQELLFREPIKQQLEAICNSDPTLYKSAEVVDQERFFQKIKKVQKTWRDDDCDVDVVANGIHLYMRFTPKEFPNAGANIKEVENPKSGFRKLLATIDNRKFYAKFIVYSDSFDIYLSARAALSEQNLLAGWEPRKLAEKKEDQNVYYDSWLGSKILFGEKPPPAPVDPNAPKPKPRIEID